MKLNFVKTLYFNHIWKSCNWSWLIHQTWHLNLRLHVWLESFLSNDFPHHTVYCIFSLLDWKFWLLGRFWVCVCVFVSLLVSLFVLVYSEKRRLNSTFTKAPLVLFLHLCEITFRATASSLKTDFHFFLGLVWGFFFWLFLCHMRSTRLHSKYKWLC